MGYVDGHPPFPYIISPIGLQGPGSRKAKALLAAPKIPIHQLPRGMLTREPTSHTTNQQRPHPPQANSQTSMQGPNIPQSANLQDTEMKLQ